jgi:cytoskeleton protein RodZ
MSEAEQVAQQVSAGTLLRRAREAAGLHVAALAVSLKVPVRKLEALEEDRYEEMGDAVFIRALASSVCRALKIEPQPVLDRLPQPPAPRLVRDNEGLNTPFRAPKDGPAPSWIDAVRQPAPLTALALLIGMAVIALWPASRREEAQFAVAPARTPASAPAVPDAAASAPSTASAAAPAASAVEVTMVSRPAAPVALSAPAIATAATASAAAATPVPAASAPATGIVVFHAKGESWVEVVDAKGAIPLRKLLASGETAGASGALPLQVTIGKVDMTEVDVRGKKFDLRPVSKDNVARFEIK